MDQPFFKIECHCGGAMERTSVSDIDKTQIQVYECTVCHDQLSLTREAKG